MHPSVLIVIPCYNEEKSIGNLLREIKDLGLAFDVLVIDDGSGDRTYEIASEFYTCIKLLANLGIGGAVQTGIKYAYNHNYDFCVQVDGDGQHPPVMVNQLLKKSLESSANIVIGSRFIHKDGFQSTWKRRLGIHIISQVIVFLFGHRITDPTSGLRMLDKTAIKLFSQQYPRDFPEPISLAFGIEYGLTIQEIPVKMRSRVSGKSSIFGIKTFTYMLRVIGYLIIVRIGRYI